MLRGATIGLGLRGGTFRGSKAGTEIPRVWVKKLAQGLARLSPEYLRKTTIPRGGRRETGRIPIGSLNRIGMLGRRKALIFQEE